MPQHLWCETERFRVCEVCDVRQVLRKKLEWLPEVSTICPGDQDEDGEGGSRRRPNAPAGPATRVLDLA